MINLSKLMPYVIIFSGIVAVCLGIWAYFVVRKQGTPSHLTDNTSSVLEKEKYVVGFGKTITSPMKIFYLVGFFCMTVPVFNSVGHYVLNQLGGFSGPKESKFGTNLFLGLFFAIIVLEFFHFIRMYLYLHFLEEPTSLIHRKYISPMSQKHSKIEFVVRVILILFVSLKLVDPLLGNIDSFRMFTGYLLGFYIFLWMWDFIVYFNSDLQISRDTYLCSNSVAIICLSLLYFYALPSPEVLNDKTVVLKNGEYTVAVLAVFGLVCSLLGSFFAPLFFRLTLKPKQAMQITHNDSPSTWDLFKECYRELTTPLKHGPNYGKRLNLWIGAAFQKTKKKAFWQVRREDVSLQKARHRIVFSFRTGIRKGIDSCDSCKRNSSRPIHRPEEDLCSQRSRRACSETALWYKLTRSYDIGRIGECWLRDEFPGFGSRWMGSSRSTKRQRIAIRASHQGRH